MTEARLEDALAAARPSAGGRPDGADMAEAVADELGIPADDVQSALESAMPGDGMPPGDKGGPPPDDGQAAPPSN